MRLHITFTITIYMLFRMAINVCTHICLMRNKLMLCLICYVIYSV